LMIGQQTPLGYVVQALILGQPFLWMRLYDADIHVSEWFKHLFYIGGAVAVEAVWFVKASIGFYTTTLIMQYIALTMLAVYLYSQRYPVKQAVCLGFLTVFLNSFYWELPLHIIEFVLIGFYPAQLVQLWRLTPLIWFYKRSMLTMKNGKTLVYGFLFSLAALFYRNMAGIFPWNPYLHPLNRLVCLLVLVYVIIGGRNGVDGG